MTRLLLLSLFPLTTAAAGAQESDSASAVRSIRAALADGVQAANWKAAAPHSV